MKEYEIVAKFLNGCAGAAHPQTFFEEAALNSTDDFVRTKHNRIIPAVFFPGFLSALSTPPRRFAVSIAVDPLIIHQAPLEI